MRHKTGNQAALPKGYWIARVDVTDPDGCKSYVEANAEAFAKYGARFLVRGGRFELVEGAPRARNVVIEFADYETALACYRSPEYRRAAAFRSAASVGDLIVIEGYDGPQPSWRGPERVVGARRPRGRRR